MVGNLNNSVVNSDNTEAVPERVIIDHNINPLTLRNLIKNSLEPLPTDPVPTRIVINNIIITKDSTGGLALSCDVFYECVA